MRALALAQFRSFAGWAPTVLRVVVGIIFTAHGWLKVQNGVSGFAGFLASLNIPAPEVMAWVVTLLETVGGIMLILGLLTRLVSLLFALEMIGTTLLVKRDIGLIAQQTTGAEIDIALFAGVVALLFLGPGKAAVDNGIGLGDSAAA